MPTLHETRSIEYDFTLEFEGPCPFDMGHVFDSEACDAVSRHVFAGSAIIVAGDTTYQREGKPGKTILYLKVFKHIE